MNLDLKILFYKKNAARNYKYRYVFFGLLIVSALINFWVGYLFFKRASDPNFFAGSPLSASLDMPKLIELFNSEVIYSRLVVSVLISHLYGALVASLFGVFLWVLAFYALAKAKQDYFLSSVLSELYGESRISS